jgi:CheY-like chemotaxis protein
VTLPASTDEPPALRRATARALVSGQGHVLVVDDDAAVRVAARRALEVLGYSVTEATDGLSAVQIFSADPSRFDAVLLDVSMPGLDGRETYLALRDITPEVRVVLTTGHALNELAQQILDLGVQGFIEKPFDIFELSVAISEVLRGT